VKRNKANLYLLLGLLAIAVVFAYAILRPFLRPIVFAIIIGIGFYPLHEVIRKGVRAKSLSSLLSTLIVLLVFLVPAVIVASSASGDIVRAAQYIGTKSAQDGGIFTYVYGLLERPMTWLQKYVDLDETGIRAAVDSLPSRTSKLLLAAAAPLVAGVATFAGEAIVTIFVLFFVFRDGARAAKRLAGVVPMSRDQVNRLFFLIHQSVIANLYGILAVALAQGLLVAIAILIVGVHPVILLAAAAAVCSLIPLVGSSLVWLPIAIYLLATGHLWKGIFFIAWCLVVVGTADNIIRPLVIGGRVKLHPLVLLFALIGGVEQFGFLGLFIGPIVMSLIVAIVGMVREEMAAHDAETANV
jgi:predicted PurR-regulated permease PerM